VLLPGPGAVLSAAGRARSTAVDDLRSAVAGLPGIGGLMRRGDEDVAEPESRPGDTHGATRART
jgi:hypothetical protein